MPEDAKNPIKQEPAKPDKPTTQERFRRNRRTKVFENRHVCFRRGGTHRLRKLFQRTASFGQ